MKVNILSLCVLAFLFTFSTQTFAVDFGVNFTSDQHDENLADGFCDVFLNVAGAQCTLRAAVEQANALASNDRIFFLLPNNSTVTLTTAKGGEIQIEDNGTLEVIGMGANNLTIDGGAGTNRIFYTYFATVLITGVTLTGGEGAGAGFNGAGGAIYADHGSMTLERVHVTGNAATNSAGGVYFGSGTHQMIGSTVSANTGTFCAGINNNGTLTIVNSTISGNTAIQGGSGGGFCNNALISVATLRNVTITNNTAFVGGGFCNLGNANATLRNVTITNNTALAGGGIFQSAGTSQNILNFGNTIIAGNIANLAPEIRFVTGTLISAGYNLVGDEPGDSNNPGIPISYQQTDILDKPPMLSPLQNNGGSTPTHVLLFGSPAIDAGLNSLASNAGLTTDQRGTGFSRFRDGYGDSLAFVDIGAVEVEMQIPTAAGVSVGGRVTTASGRGITGVSISLTDSDGNVRTTISTSLGEYRFDDVEAGNTYVLTAAGKRFTFTQPSLVLNVSADAADVNFIANTASKLRDTK
jgi:hypothetical protein